VVLAPDRRQLLGRVAQVALLVLTGLPVLCFIGVFGGLEMLPLFALLLVTTMAVVALGSASMLASVWSRHTRDAVLGLYAVGGTFFVLAWWLEPALLDLFSPLYVLEPTWGGLGRANIDEFGRRLLWSSLAWGGLTVVSLSLAVWRLRPAYIHQLEASGPRTGNWLGVRRPPVPEDPLPWKERHVEGLAPLKSLRVIPTWLAMLVIFTVTAITSTAIVLPYLTRRCRWGTLRPDLSRFDAGALLLGDADRRRTAADAIRRVLRAEIAMLLASLMVAFAPPAPSAASAKSRRGSTLLTPMTSRQIIAGKLWASWAPATSTSWPTRCRRRRGGRRGRRCSDRDLAGGHLAGDVLRRRGHVVLGSLEDLMAESSGHTGDRLCRRIPGVPC
jgi:hypothetical protein